MRTLTAVLICVVLLPAAISNPEQTRFPTVSAGTVTLREVRRGSEIGAVTGLGDSRDTLSWSAQSTPAKARSRVCLSSMRMACCCGAFRSGTVAPRRP